MLTRRLASLSEAHQLAGLESPAAMTAVRTLMSGIRRAKGTAAQPKKPVLVPDLERMMAALPDNLFGLRDAALLLVGFAGAFRRSKDRSRRQGRKIGIPYGRRAELCPVRVLEAWRDEAGSDHGAVFVAVDRHGNVSRARLSDRAVARAIKRRIEAAGLVSADYAGHSLRAGFATAAANGGATERAIMNQTGHRSLPILRRYIREGSLFQDNPVRSTGL